MCMKIG